jgi:predicted transposase YdaD
MKYYRDLKNSIDTAREEGEICGIEKGIEKGREEIKIQTVLMGIKEGLSIEILSKLKGMDQSEIEKLLDEKNNHKLLFAF